MSVQTLHSGHRRGSPEFSRIVIALVASGLATFTVLYCVQALLPELADDFHLSPATASLALSVSTAALAIGVIPLTTLSESVGRTKVMTLSLAVTAVLGLLVPFSPNFPILLALRALQGLALAGLQATAMSYLSEELHRGSLGAGMGLYIAGNGIGGMAGRLLAGLVVDFWGWRMALGAVGVLAAVCAVLFRMTILPSQRFEPKPLRVRPLARSVAQSFTDGGLLRLYAIGFLAMGSFVTVYNYLGFRLLGGSFGLSQAVVGSLFVVYLAGSAASTGAGRLVDKFGRPRMLWLMASTVLVGIALLFPDNLVLVVLGLIVLTGGFFATHAVASGWVGARSATVRGQGPAIYLFCYYLGSAVGGTVGGVFYSAGGWSSVTGYIGSMFVVLLLLAVSLRKLQPASPR